MEVKKISSLIWDITRFRPFITFFIRVEPIASFNLSRFEKFVIFLRQFYKITTEISDFWSHENRETDI